MKYILVAALLFFISNANADNTFYCSQTNQSVTLGQTTSQVFAICGAPTSTSEAQQAQLSTNGNLAVQWIYVRGNVLNTQGILGSPNVASLIFTIQNGIVTQIQRNGTGFVGSVGCNVATTFAPNSTTAAIQILCGNPNYVIPVPQTSTQQQTITTWVYNRGPFQPQIIFTFTDGILSGIKSGQLGH